MNCGVNSAAPFEIAELLDGVTLVSEAGQSEYVSDIRTLGHGNRTSDIIRNGWIVTSARFRMIPSTPPEALRRRIRAILKARRAKFPLSLPTAGSTFKNPIGRHTAGWYIERCGLKGAAIGGAAISFRHANWIENRGAAKAHDIRDLIALVQDRVHARFGICLDPEIQCLG